jgi:hypothetical protein
MQVISYEKRSCPNPLCSSDLHSFVVDRDLRVPERQILPAGMAVVAALETLSDRLNTCEVVDRRYMLPGARTLVLHGSGIERSEVEQILQLL